ncbi:hypothetical protein OH77DRAFT_1417828, partial [Trametes cingulata]
MCLRDASAPTPVAGTAVTGPLPVVATAPALLSGPAHCPTPATRRAAAVPPIAL